MSKHKIVGLNAMIREMEKLSVATPSPQGRAALDAAAHNLYGISQSQVGVRTGRLKRSGELTTGASEVPGQDWAASISYGDQGDVFYAPIVFAKEGQDPFTSEPFVAALETVDEAVMDAVDIRDNRGK